MVILVSNVATDHCHQSVTKGYRKKKKKKRPTVLSSAPASVFASLGIFAHAPIFVSTSPPTFFGFAPIFFRFCKTRENFNFSEKWKK